MARVTEPLRAEHRELLPHVEALKQTADSLSVPASLLSVRQTQEALSFLTGHLIPHAQAEEEALYPVVAQAMGSPLATKTMSRDHIEVGALTTELERVLGAKAWESDEAAMGRLRGLLFGLYALVKVHFAKEEEVYLPLLDEKLSPEAASEMFERMEQAAGRAKAAASR